MHQRPNDRLPWRRPGRRTRLLAAVAALAATGCGDEVGEFGEEAIEETVVVPGGSTIAVRYWIGIPLFGIWSEVPAIAMPHESRVTHVTTVVGAPPSLSITGPALAASTESTVVALFTGGRAPPALTSARAALYLAGQPMVTGLQMTTARNGHAMAVLPGEKVLVVGGYGTEVPPGLASAEVFTLSTRAFAPTGSMRVARHSHTATPLPDGRVLVAGGSVSAQLGFTTATTEIFDPATGTFSDGPAMSTPRFNHSAVPLPDGRVLILGGNGLKSAEVYAPSTNSFSPVGSMSVNHGLGHVALRLRNGKVLVLGGDATFNIQPSATAELFDPATGTFSAAGSMTVPRMQHFAVLQDDGRVLIGGGRTTGGNPLKSAELFDPSNNSFTPVADLPSETYDGPAAFVTGRRSP